MHIIETILYRFRPILHSDKDGHQMPFREWCKHAHHKSKMTDGCHLGKIEESPYRIRSNCLSDRHEINWHCDAVRPSWPVRLL